MGMVTEMRIPGGDGGPGVRFNYRGMHRYLITLLPHPACASFAGSENVLPTLDALRDACLAHGFETYAYCFLPDRLVLLVRGKDDGSDMKLFLAAFRAGSSASSERRTGKPLWSRKYRERVLRKTEVTRAVADEIFLLPVKAGLATRPGSYALQGSFVLAGVPRVARQARPQRKAAGPRGRPGPRRPSGTRRP